LVNSFGIALVGLLQGKMRQGKGLFKEPAAQSFFCLFKLS